MIDHFRRWRRKPGFAFMTWFASGLMWWFISMTRFLILLDFVYFCCYFSWWLPPWWSFTRLISPWFTFRFLDGVFFLRFPFRFLDRVFPSWRMSSGWLFGWVFLFLLRAAWSSFAFLWWRVPRRSPLWLTLFPLGDWLFHSVWAFYMTEG